MLRTIVLGAVMAVSLQGCKGQKAAGKMHTDKNMPQTNIKVNKQYDKNGNLVRYDSTYSYYYSNVKNDSTLKDSILGNFENQFNHKYFFSNKPYFKDFFFQDSLMKYDFYKKDFFYDRFVNNMRRMDQLFHEMDSVKNRYFSQQFKNMNNKADKHNGSKL